MANHSADLSRIQPQQQGIPVAARNPMPVSRGSMFAGVPAPRPNQHVTPKMIRVSGLPAGTPALDLAPVPPSSVYEPPEEVRAASPLPDSLA